MKKTLSIFTFTLAFFALGLFLRVSSSSAAQFYLQPASGSVQSDNTITVNVRLNTGSLRTATADLYLNYDAIKLSVVSYSNSGSPLSSAIGIGTVGGVISGTQYVPPGAGGTPPVPVSGDFLFGTVVFKALGNSGTTSVTFNTAAGKSVIYDFDQQTPPGNPNSTMPLTASNGSYTLTGAPTPPPPPAPLPPPPPPVSGGVKPPPPPTAIKPPPPPVVGGVNPPPPPAVVNPPTDNGSRVGTTNVPKITNVKITDSSETSVTIEWTTDQDSTSVVEYGTSASYGFSQGTASYTKNHKIVLPPARGTKLKAKTTYHFKVASTNQAGNTATSSDGIFKTENLSGQKGIFRNVGLALIIGGLIALVVVVFFFFKNRGKMSPDSGVNTNPPI